jgi:hypothetical protein
MKLKQLIVALAVIALLILLGACGPQAKQEPAQVKQEPVQTINLDRQGLVDFMGKYLAALVAHDPKAVPFAKDVKFVENTAKIPVGDGLWVTAAGGPGEFQIMAADPTAQQVACLVMMKENKGADILLGARLKVVNGKITEAEHLVIRDLTSSPAGANALKNLQKPRPALLEDVTAEDKTPYEQMVKVGLSYYDALTGEDGKLAPFADDCERRENGMTTAGTREKIGAPPGSDPATQKAMMAFPRTCEGQISTGTFAYITDIKSRRVLVADEQKGLAVGFSMFFHRGAEKEMPIKNVPGVTSVPAGWGTFNLPAMHIYKIRKGKIYEIEAIGFTMPYGLTSGWD